MEWALLFANFLGMFLEFPGIVLLYLQADQVVAGE
jgi:hypothetical protein